MTDQEIVYKRMVEIIKSHGYDVYLKDINQFTKFDGKYNHSIVINKDYNTVELSCNECNGLEDNYNTGFLTLDYEELTLLIDIFNKNYH